MRKIFASIALLLTNFSSIAAPPITDFDKIKNTNVGKMYILGMGEAFLAASVYNINRKNSPLYCQPQNLQLTESNYILIIENQLKNDKTLSVDTPINLVLLEGLISTFPCPKATNK